MIIIKYQPSFKELMRVYRGTGRAWFGVISIILRFVRNVRRIFFCVLCAADLDSRRDLAKALVKKFRERKMLMSHRPTVRKVLDQVSISFTWLRKNVLIGCLVIPPPGRRRAIWNSDSWDSISLKWFPRLNAEEMVWTGEPCTIFWRFSSKTHTSTSSSVVTTSNEEDVVCYFYKTGHYVKDSISRY